MAIICLHGVQRKQDLSVAVSALLRRLRLHIAPLMPLFNSRCMLYCQMDVGDVGGGGRKISRLLLNGITEADHKFG